ncbi:serine protease [Streptomyces althioticus]|uniref:S1 family peptidase n=1 Tax=Streptomyces althioticus TaxID=83380 RepID=UPI0033F1C49B
MRCTVRVSSASNSGTGFFVAPGQVITCAHVVAEAHRKSEVIHVEVVDAKHVATVRFVCPRPPHVPAQIPDPYPWHDVAWLQIDFTRHPCALLDDQEPSLANPADTGWAHGFTDRFESHIFRPASASFVFEGPANGIGDDGRRWVLKSGQASPGLSGAPLLNVSTNKVFGILTRTRDAFSDLGAWSVHVSEALRKVPELIPLLEDNRLFHEHDKTWEDALTRTEIAARHKLSIIWVCSGDVRSVDSILKSVVEQLKNSWPPNELEVMQVRFTPYSGGISEQIEQYMSKVSTALVVLDADPITAACFQLATAAARCRVPTAVLSDMDLDWSSMSRLQELESDYRYSFQYEKVSQGALGPAMQAYLNRQVLTMDRKRRLNVRPNTA